MPKKGTGKPTQKDPPKSTVKAKEKQAPDSKVAEQYTTAEKKAPESKANTVVEKKKNVVSLASKTQGYFLYLDIKHNYFYKRGDILLTYGMEEATQNVRIEITESTPMDDIRKDIVANLLYIGDEEGNDVTNKFIEEFVPGKIYRTPNSNLLEEDLSSVEINILTNDFVSIRRFSEEIEALYVDGQKERLTQIKEVLEEVPNLTYNQELKLKMVRNKLGENVL